MPHATQFKDLTGKQFGRLLVLSRQENNKFNKITWLCKCSCGTEKILVGESLVQGLTKSCGCLRRKGNRTGCFKNHVGSRFGRLVVQALEEKSKHGDFRWRCLCDCGKEKIIFGGMLVSSGTKSCGCLQREEASARAKLRKGEKNPAWKGGVTPEHKLIRHSSEYKNWRTAVFVRDNYSCQECGIPGGDLHAHHIKPFALFPDLRYEVSNGQTLCPPCHQKTPTFKNKSIQK